MKTRERKWVACLAVGYSAMFLFLRLLLAHTLSISKKLVISLSLSLSYIYTQLRNILRYGYRSASRSFGSLSMTFA